MAVMVYTVTMAVEAARVRFSEPLQTIDSYSCFQAQFNSICFGCRRDTNMEDDMDWGVYRGEAKAGYIAG